MLLYSNHSNCDSEQAISVEMDPPLLMRNFFLYLFLSSLKGFNTKKKNLYCLSLGDSRVEWSVVSVVRLNVEAANETTIFPAFNFHILMT